MQILKIKSAEYKKPHDVWTGLSGASETIYQVLNRTNSDSF